jgi:phage tail sheath protein FI
VPMYYAPGIYVEEVSTGTKPIQPVGTSTAAFVGETPFDTAHVNEAVAIENWTKFTREYVQEGSVSTALSHAVFGFFQNGGRRCYVVNSGKGQPIGGGGRSRRGLDVLDAIDEVAIVAAPGFTDAASYEALLTHCENMKDRVAILDCPAEVKSIDLLTKVATSPVPRRPARREGGETPDTGTPPSTEPTGYRARTSANGYGAQYWPWITMRDPLSEKGAEVIVPPSGHIAGIYARTDATRGVHKAPANETVRGALNVSYQVTREEQAELNQVGINCIRFFTREGILVWGARTLADAASEWRYVNVRRLFNLVEESIGLGTRWVVFEPNDRTLWKSIERDIRAFLRLLWRDGALMGRTPEEAFFVHCNEETNPRESIDAGIVMTRIGIAPVKPAEFVVFRIGQYAGGTIAEPEGGANG